MTTLATSTVRVATSLTSIAAETRSWGLELLLRIYIYQHGCGDWILELLLRIQDLIWSGGQGGGEDHCEAGEGY